MDTTTGRVPAPYESEKIIKDVCRQHGTGHFYQSAFPEPGTTKSTGSRTFSIRSKRGEHLQSGALICEEKLQAFHYRRTVRRRVSTSDYCTGKWLTGPKLFRRRRTEPARQVCTCPVQGTSVFYASKRVMNFCGVVHPIVHIGKTSSKSSILCGTEPPCTLPTWEPFYRPSCGKRPTRTTECCDTQPSLCRYHQSTLPV